MTKEQYEQLLDKALTFYEANDIKNKYIESLEKTIRLKESHIKSLKYEIEKIKG